MAKHTFTVKGDRESEAHQVTVNFPTFEEATEGARKVAWNDARANITVKVQGTLRRRIAKGLRGDRLNVEAQAAVDAVLAGIRRQAAALEPVDAKALGLNKAQVEGLRAAGVPVINI